MNFSQNLYPQNHLLHQCCQDIIYSDYKNHTTFFCSNSTWTYVSLCILSISNFKRSFNPVLLVFYILCGFGKFSQFLVEFEIFAVRVLGKSLFYKLYKSKNNQIKTIINTKYNIKMML